MLCFAFDFYLIRLKHLEKIKKIRRISVLKHL